MIKPTFLGWTVILWIAVLCLAAFEILRAQTQPAPRNLAPTIPGGIIFVIAPDGRTAFARLDSSLQLTADSENFLVLRAAPAAIVDRVVTFKTTAAGTTLTLPSDPQGNSLLVHCNGLALSEGEDYTRAGRVLTFVEAHAPKPDYIFHIRYRE